MARADPQINFRIPAALKQQLETAMARSGNSLTGEIVARLEASFQHDQGLSLASVVAKIDHMSKAVEQLKRERATKK